MEENEEKAGVSSSMEPAASVVATARSVENGNGRITEDLAPAAPPRHPAARRWSAASASSPGTGPTPPPCSAMAASAVAPAVMPLP